MHRMSTRHCHVARNTTFRITLQGWVDMYKGTEVKKRFAQLRHNTRYRVRVKVGSPVHRELRMFVRGPYDDIFSMLSWHTVRAVPRREGCPQAPSGSGDPPHGMVSGL